MNGRREIQSPLSGRLVLLVVRHRSVLNNCAFAAGHSPLALLAPKVDALVARELIRPGEPLAAAGILADERLLARVSTDLDQRQAEACE